MKAGQKLVDKSGNQIMLFPLDYMDITQWHGEGTYSHTCGCEFDTTGKTSEYPLYAPCDCHVIYKYDTNIYGYTRLYTNDVPVRCPDGVHEKGSLTFGFTHRNGVLDQESFKQGDHIYNTGTSGNVTGDHVHIDQSITANAQLIPCASNPSASYIINGSSDPTKFWYVNDTTINNGWGQEWQTYDGGDTPTPTPSEEYEYHYFLLDGLGIDFGFYKTKKEEPGPTPTPSGDWFIPGDINNTRALTDEESKQNWIAFWTFFKAKGWTANAVAGILGNSYYESTVNPNRWEGDVPFAEPVASRGYGLVQWTPWTKIIEWLKEKGYYPDVSKFGQGECERIQWEMENNQQWIATTSYPESFAEFSKSTADPYNLAIEFLANYERPADPNQPQRGTKAREIYDYIKDK